GAAGSPNESDGEAEHQEEKDQPHLDSVPDGGRHAEWHLSKNQQWFVPPNAHRDDQRRHVPPRQRARQRYDLLLRRHGDQQRGRKREIQRVLRHRKLASARAARPFGRDTGSIPLWATNSARTVSALRFPGARPRGSQFNLRLKKNVNEGAATPSAQLPESSAVSSIATRDSRDGPGAGSGTSSVATCDSRE